MVAPARWFYLKLALQHGPYDLDQMHALVLDQTIGPDTYVWADGMPSWMEARRVPALVPPVQLGLRDWPTEPVDD